MATYNPNDKQIGSYLIDAGLLTQQQVALALTEQKHSRLKFGEIIVSRGWVKKQTLEYIAGKVISLERTLGCPLDKKLFENVYRERKQRTKGSL